MQNDGERLDEVFESPQGETQDWYFDLPQGAWERQEEKNRNLRQTLLNKQAEPPAPHKDAPEKSDQKDEKKRGWFGRGKDQPAAEDSTRPRFQRLSEETREERRARLEAMHQQTDEGEGASDDWTTDPAALSEASQPLLRRQRSDEEKASFADYSSEEPKSRWDAMFGAGLEEGSIVEGMRQWARGDEGQPDADAAIEPADSAVEADEDDWDIEGDGRSMLEILRARRQAHEESPVEDETADSAVVVDDDAEVDEAPVADLVHQADDVAVEPEMPQNDAAQATAWPTEVPSQPVEQPSQSWLDEALADDTDEAEATPDEAYPQVVAELPVDEVAVAGDSTEDEDDGAPWSSFASDMRVAEKSLEGIEQPEPALTVSEVESDRVFADGQLDELELEGDFDHDLSVEPVAPKKRGFFKRMFGIGKDEAVGDGDDVTAAVVTGEWLRPDDEAVETSEPLQVGEQALSEWEDVSPAAEQNDAERRDDFEAMEASGWTPVSPTEKRELDTAWMAPAGSTARDAAAWDLHPASEAPDPLGFMDDDAADDDEDDRWAAFSRTASDEEEEEMVAAAITDPPMLEETDEDDGPAWEPAPALFVNQQDDEEERRPSNWDMATTNDSFSWDPASEPAATEEDDSAWAPIAEANVPGEAAALSSVLEDVDGLEDPDDGNTLEIPVQAWARPAWDPAPMVGDEDRWAPEPPAAWQGAEATVADTGPMASVDGADNDAEETELESEWAPVAEPAASVVEDGSFAPAEVVASSAWQAEYQAEEDEGSEPEDAASGEAELAAVMEWTPAPEEAPTDTTDAGRVVHETLAFESPVVEAIADDRFGAETTVADENQEYDAPLDAETFAFPVMDATEAVGVDISVEPGAVAADGESDFESEAAPASDTPYGASDESDNTPPTAESEAPATTDWRIWNAAGTDTVAAFDRETPAVPEGEEVEVPGEPHVAPISSPFFAVSDDAGDAELEASLFSVFDDPADEAAAGTPQGWDWSKNVTGPGEATRDESDDEFAPAAPEGFAEVPVGERPDDDRSPATAAVVPEEPAASTFAWPFAGNAGDDEEEDRATDSNGGEEEPSAGILWGVSSDDLGEEEPGEVEESEAPTNPWAEWTAGRAVQPETAGAPEQADDDDAGAAFDHGDDDSAVPDTEAPAASAAGDDEEDDEAWAAIAAASGYDADDEAPPPTYGVPLGSYGPREGRNSWLADNFPEQPPRPDPVEEAFKDFDDADMERDLVLRAFEAHAASEVEEKPEPLEPGAFAALFGAEADHIVDEMIEPREEQSFARMRAAPQRSTVGFAGSSSDPDEWMPGDGDSPGVAAASLETDLSAVPFLAAATGRHEDSGKKTRTWVRELVETGLLALLVFLSVRASFQNFKVDGSSMFPTLEDGQFLIVNKLVYSEVDVEKLGKVVPFVNAGDDPTRHVFHGPQRGDIIVLRDPGNPEVDLIKRVVGLPGEKIEIIAGSVYIDDQRLEEPYITRPWGQGDNPRGAVIIPDGAYFVMGDNRDNSKDSRNPSIGFVDEDLIIGRAELSYLPLSAFGLIGDGGPSLSERDGRPTLTSDLRPGVDTLASVR